MEEMLTGKEQKFHPPPPLLFFLEKVDNTAAADTSHSFVKPISLTSSSSSNGVGPFRQAGPSVDAIISSPMIGKEREQKATKRKKEKQK